MAYGTGLENPDSQESREFESHLHRLRIIFLNTWFGKAGKPFFDFIKEKSAGTDIFCFMEVSPKLYSNLRDILKGFSVLYEEGHFLKSLGDVCGQATFLSRGINVRASGKISIYRQSDRDVGFLQFSELIAGGKKFFLGNVHGKTLPGSKFDTPVRLKQSEKIINFFSGKNGPITIGGDFNLNPDTKSVKKFEEAGYKNLIKDFKVKSTRNNISWQQFSKDDPNFVKQYFADYVFVSAEVRVRNFEVPYVEISDHLPLILDFEI